MKSFTLALIWTACFVIGTVIGAYGQEDPFVGSGYSYASDEETDKQEAINSYLGDDYTPRARYSRESEGYEVWHTIEELNRKDEQQRLIDRNFIINQNGEKIKI